MEKALTLSGLGHKPNWNFDQVWKVKSHSLIAVKIFLSAHTHCLWMSTFISDILCIGSMCVISHHILYVSLFESDELLLKVFLYLTNAIYCT